MKPGNNPVIPVVSQAGIDELAQRIGEVLNTNQELLAKVKDINISVVPDIAHRVDITITPKN